MEADEQSGTSSRVSRRSLLQRKRMEKRCRTSAYESKRGEERSDMQIFPDMSGIGAAAARPAQAQDTGSASGTGSSTTNTATVTANDFLQLLIAEMKNQDPTSNTDPTQYINQLVQVNSLEQLVQINQDLGGGTTSSTASGDAADGNGIGASPGAHSAAAGN